MLGKENNKTDKAHFAMKKVSEFEEKLLRASDVLGVYQRQ